MKKRHARQEPTAADLADLQALAQAGELAGPLAHEVNNLLNNLMLHWAVLPNAGDDVTALKRHAEHLAQLVKHWQQWRRPPSKRKSSADLNQVVRAAVKALHASSAHAAVSIHLELAKDLVPLAASAFELERMISLLLMRAAAITGAGPIAIATGQTDGKPWLRVADSGPSYPPDQAAKLFDPGAATQEPYPLVLAACKALVKRLKGRIEATVRPEGGTSLEVTF